MENTYVVYLNKRNDVYARDAHTWAKNNNILVKDENIISEVIFYNFLDRGLLDGKAIYFCKDIQDDRIAWEDKLNNQYKINQL
jgi:hypothetical protein